VKKPTWKILLLKIHLNSDFNAFGYCVEKLKEFKKQDQNYLNTQNHALPSSAREFKSKQGWLSLFNHISCSPEVT